MMLAEIALRWPIHWLIGVIIFWMIVWGVVSRYVDKG